VAALLCGLLGVAGGLVVAWLVQPRPAHGGLADPVPALSPSVPIDVPTVKPPAADISYPRLSPDLALPTQHTIHNALASWTYHVPQGWTAYAVCTATDHCRPPMTADTVLEPGQIEKQPEVRFRPSDEPTVGGYSLRVRILDNTLGFNTAQMADTKVRGFRQAYPSFRITHRTPSAVYFTYRDELDHQRYNYFQWFAVDVGGPATLEMSVAGRQRDVPGLKAMFDRFADNVSGSLPGTQRSEQPAQPQGSAGAPSSSGTPSGASTG